VGLGFGYAQPTGVAGALALVFVEVEACFAGHCINAFLLKGLEGFGGNTELDEALALGPPDALVLQVGLLEALGAAVGVGDGEGVVGLFAGEVADFRHGILLTGVTHYRQQWASGQKAVLSAG
jgi:hypothetical protein